MSYEWWDEGLTFGVGGNKIKEKVGDVLVDTFTSRNEERAIKNAARSQAEAMDKATDLQREMYTQNRADLMPWMDSSKKYLGRMGELYDQGAFNMPNEDLEGPAFNFDMQMDPGFQFRMDNALKALKASQSARGSRLSGGSMAGLMDRAQGVASDEYGNAFNRQYGMYNDQYQRRGNAYNRRASNMANQFNQLSGMGGMGASQSMVGLGQNYGNQMGNLYMQQGQNQANSIMAQQQARQNNPWNTKNLLTPDTAFEGLGLGLEWYKNRNS
jgi:hypothetical protein